MAKKAKPMTPEAIEALVLALENPDLPDAARKQLRGMIQIQKIPFNLVDPALQERLKTVLTERASAAEGERISLAVAKAQNLAEGAGEAVRSAGREARASATRAAGEELSKYASKLPGTFPEADDFDEAGFDERVRQREIGAKAREARTAEAEKARRAAEPIKGKSISWEKRWAKKWPTTPQGVRRMLVSGGFASGKATKKLIPEQVVTTLAERFKALAAEGGPAASLAGKKEALRTLAAGLEEGMATATGKGGLTSVLRQILGLGKGGALGAVARGAGRVAGHPATMIGLPIAAMLASNLQGRKEAASRLPELVPDASEMYEDFMLRDMLQRNTARTIATAGLSGSGMGELPSLQGASPGMGGGGGLPASAGFPG